MIGVIFLLLIVISTLSLTYREQLKEDEHIVSAKNSLLQQIEMIQQKLLAADYPRHRLSYDLAQLKVQVLEIKENNALLNQKLKTIKQNLLEISQSYEQQLKQQHQQKEILRTKLETVRNSRLVPQKLLQEMAQQFKNYKIPATIDAKNGIIHFADSLLFTTGNADLTKKGKNILQQVAQIFSKVLPCYSKGAYKQSGCSQIGQKQVEAIFIEGHTDNVPYVGNTYDNWQLSMRRARETYKQLIAVVPELEKIKNNNSQPMFSLSAYGKTRPIASNKTRAGRQKNRRIDIRLISVGYTLDSLMKKK